MKLTIRPLKQHDLPNVKQLNEECLPENYPESVWLGLFTLSAGKNHSFVAAHGSGRIMGYIFGTGSGNIVSFAVAEKFRKRGLGKSLMAHCLQSYGNPNSSDRGVPMIKLNVRVSNEPAIACYQQFGFQVAQHIPKYYQNPIEDAYEMTTTPLLTPPYQAGTLRRKFNFK